MREWGKEGSMMRLRDRREQGERVGERGVHGERLGDRGEHSKRVGEEGSMVRLWGMLAICFRLASYTHA